jgi:BirA family biotin operon repressor/biotin-[acetyl-CoA-carboxylase] ligase
MERVWQSPGGRNLYLSMILKPPISPALAPQVTLMAGVAVAELLDPYCPGRVAIKWPNDILIGGKKICGILTEMKSTAAGVDFIVLGIGINVNMGREDFGRDLRDAATSLALETGQMVDRLTVMRDLFESIEKWYRLFLREGFEGIRNQFLAFADIMGKEIEVHFNNDMETGRVVGISDEGAIIMEAGDGVARRITAGDVLIRRG